MISITRNRFLSQISPLCAFYRRQLHPITFITSDMKRTASSLHHPSHQTNTKRSRPSSRSTQVPEYHLAKSFRDKEGNITSFGPHHKRPSRRRGASFSIGTSQCGAISLVNVVLYCFFLTCELSVAAGQRTLVVPDKDADGLTSGVIVERTLKLLGLREDLISIFLPEKGHTVHDAISREAMSIHPPVYVIVLDQGSRKSPPLVEHPHKGLVIDHHYAEKEDHPLDSLLVTACHCPPVATSSLLTYLICRGLHEAVEEQCDWLCVVGTHGDLGNTLKWEPPFPDMKATLNKYTKKSLNEAVSLLNAPRRTASYNVSAGWDALRNASSPKEIIGNRTLLQARAEVSAEVERCTHAAPKFSADGRVAVLRISSAAQVHPVIAARWAGHLSSAKLEVVLVANEGYLPGKINFSCRIARCARGKDSLVNIIEVLQEVAGRARDPSLRERLGDSFARGHKEASGGIVPKAEFEELMEVLEVGKKVDRGGRKPKTNSGQGNTLLDYFQKG